MMDLLHSIGLHIFHGNLHGHKIIRELDFPSTSHMNQQYCHNLRISFRSCVCSKASPTNKKITHYNPFWELLPLAMALMFNDTSQTGMYHPSSTTSLARDHNLPYNSVSSVGIHFSFIFICSGFYEALGSFDTENVF